MPDEKFFELVSSDAIHLTFRYETHAVTILFPRGHRKSITLDPFNHFVADSRTSRAINDVIDSRRRFLHRLGGRPSFNSFALSSDDLADFLTLLTRFLTRVSNDRVISCRPFELFLHLTPWVDTGRLWSIFRRITRFAVMLNKMNREMLELRQVEAIQPDHGRRRRVVAVVLPKETEVSAFLTR